MKPAGFNGGGGRKGLAQDQAIQAPLSRLAAAVAYRDTGNCPVVTGSGKSRGLTPTTGKVLETEFLMNRILSKPR